MMRASFRILLAFAPAMAMASGSPTIGHANPLRNAVLDAFAQNCFSPHLTAARAAAAFAPTGAAHDFYDLRPFSAPEASPAKTNVTPGTDRRCEVTFGGDYGSRAAEVAAAAAQAEGITRDAPLPSTHANAALPGTTLIAARFLNPARIAVVHTGTRPGPNGPETFLSVERLTPEATQKEVSK